MADWVLFKIIKLKKEKNEEPNVQNNKKKIKVVEKNKNLDTFNFIFSIIYIHRIEISKL